MNHNELREIATYLYETGLTSKDEAALLERYDNDFTIEEVLIIRNYIAESERQAVKC